MGYIKNLINHADIYTVLFSLGLGVVITGIVFLVYFYVSAKRGKWRANMKMDAMAAKQKDAIDKFIDSTEKNMSKSKLKLKISPKAFVFATAAISVILFIWSFVVFKNLFASILLSIIAFSIPDYMFFIMQDRLDKKIQEQTLIGVRVFTAEFLKTRNIEKSMAEASQRVPYPVGDYFADAYGNMLMGHSFDSVISRMNTYTDNNHWKIFVQLLYQLRGDSTVIHLFTDLITRIERGIEASRNNESTLSGERTLALIMSLIPLPAYFMMRDVVPETAYFVVETGIGRLVLVLSFISTLMFLVVDKYSRKI
jgi:Flp pilus assembly protein TadB